MVPILLVTYFTPFGGRKFNVSNPVATQLPNRINEYRVVKKEIPTNMFLVEKYASKVVNNVRPDAILCLGEFVNTQVEQRAHSKTVPEWRYGDVNGLLDGMLLYTNSVHSTDPGDYACNLIYRTMLDLKTHRTYGNIKKVAFIHLDYKKSPDELLKGVREGISKWLT